MNEIQTMVDEILFYMAKYRVTQEQLCKEVDISRPTLIKVLKGEGQIKFLVKVVEYVRKEMENKNTK